MHVSDRDILITRDNYHDWVLANERMAKALAAKGYAYQFRLCEERCALRPRREGADPAPGTGVCMAGIRAEIVNRPCEVRANGLTQPPCSALPPVAMRPRVAARSPMSGASWPATEAGECTDERAYPASHRSPRALRVRTLAGATTAVGSRFPPFDHYQQTANMASAAQCGMKRRCENADWRYACARAAARSSMSGALLAGDERARPWSRRSRRALWFGMWRGQRWLSGAVRFNFRFASLRDQDRAVPPTSPLQVCAEL